jgi:hypothetical protein
LNIREHPWNPWFQPAFFRVIAKPDEMNRGLLTLTRIKAAKAKSGSSVKFTLWFAMGCAFGASIYRWIIRDDPCQPRFKCIGPA